MHVPEEEKYLNTEAELRDMLVGLVAGRAAEELVFETVTTGAANDIEKATGIARAMVTQYGMSERFGLVGLSTVESKYLEGRDVMNCSDQTAAEVDKEVVEILKKSYEKAKELLSENRDVMDKLAAFLIEKETITGKEFMEIYRKEKGIPEPEEKKEEGGAEEAAEAMQANDAAQKEAVSAREVTMPQEATVPQAVREPEEVKTPQEAETPKETAPDGTEQQGEENEEKPSSVGVFTNRTLD